MIARPFIVLVDYNGLEDTRKCLLSLRGQTIPVRTIVVDNASRVEVAPLLQPEFPDVSFLRSPVNGGWAGGNNLGMQQALVEGADLVILLNNDTIVGPQFTERLVAAANAHPAYGIFGPVIRFMSEPHEVQTDGVVFNRPQQNGFFQRHPVPLVEQSPPGIVPVDIVNGCCLAVRRETVAQIGWIDEDFFLIHEESDFCLRSQAAGWLNGVLTESLVWHKGSSTFQREGKRLQRYFDARNLVRLLQKHGSRRGSRGRLRSALHHARYSYHRYALERETGFPDSAEAVLEGLYDGLRGHYGPMHKKSRPGLAWFRWVFAACFWLSGAKLSRRAQTGPDVAATAAPAPLSISDGTEPTIALRSHSVSQTPAPVVRSREMIQS